MCDPLTIIAASTFALSAGTAIAKHGAQAKEAKENKKESLKAFEENTKAINAREVQERDAAGRTIMQADRQARAADAMARVGAGEAGVAGASVDALLGVIESDRLDFKSTTGRNLDATIGQLEAEKRGAASTAQSRINAVPKPNVFLTGLQVGAAGLDLYGNLRKNKAANTPSTAKS